MSDSIGVSGKLDAPGDIDSFWLDLVAGQRYRIDLHAESPVAQRWTWNEPGSYSFDPMAAEGEPFRGIERLMLQWGGHPEAEPVGSVLLARGNEDSSFTFTATTSGLQQLRLSSWNDGQSLAIAYALSATQVAPDDHGDLPGGATPLTPGETVSGEIELRGDHDNFALDLAAGQTIELEVERGHIGLQQLAASVVLSIDGPAGLPLAHSQWVQQEGVNRYMLTAESAGRYIVTLSSLPFPDALGEQVVPYRITAAAASADDHTNTLEGATPLALGQTASYVLAEVGDIDWFRVDLAAEQVVRISKSNDNGATTVMLRSDGGHGLVDEGMYGPSTLWRAAEDTTLYVGMVRLVNPFPELDRDQHVLVELVDPVAKEATRVMRVDEDVRRDLGELDREHHYEAALIGGQRYRLTLWADEHVYAVSHVEGARWTTLNGLEQGDPTVIQSETDAVAMFDVHAYGLGVGEHVPYRLQLQALPADDHGEVPAFATPWAEASRIEARLDRGEYDVLRLELDAGQRYRLSARLMEGEEWGQLTLGAADADLTALLAYMTILPDERSTVFTPSTSGSYFVTMLGNGGVAELSYQAIAADDHTDIASGATWLPIAGAWNPAAEPGDDWVALVGIGHQP